MRWCVAWSSEKETAAWQVGFRTSEAVRGFILADSDACSPSDDVRGRGGRGNDGEGGGFFHAPSPVRF
jgi:hypothetical protein